MGLLQMSRKKYKDIKKYDRSQMETFIESIYTDGIKDGFKNGVNTIIEIVDSGVKNCEGIGQKRYEAIMESIHNELKKVSKEVSTDGNKEKEEKES